ncbi:MAG: hypothetical protein HYV63_19480 [Candidatus Schekmanbacteria bacterium]|nr:hypothetical protein [Candidatus Schekmanbacteria bacterium]
MKRRYVLAILAAAAVVEPGCDSGTRPEQVASGPLRFGAMDVIVDTGAAPLGAYQLTVASETDGVAIVGIEGGDAPAFPEPPYFDPQAIGRNRVILAAFDSSGAPAHGRVRVASVHYSERSDSPAQFQAALQVAADTTGTPIPATISIERVNAHED